jgi:fibronectin-binding autotransporter adhesin
MKNNASRGLTALLALLGAILLSAGSTSAATVGFWAADDARNDTLGNGNGGGYGFGNWTQINTSGGFFNYFSTNNEGGNSQGDIDTGSTGATASWGIFSNGGLTDLYRSINSVDSTDATTSKLVIGQTLRFDIDTGSVTSGKSAGFTLRNSGTDIFEFRADGSTGNYIFRVNGTDTQTSVAKTTAGLRTEFTLTGSNNFVFQIYSTANVLLQTITGTVSSDSNINVVRAFSTDNNGPAQNVYFNSLQVKLPTWTAATGTWSLGTNWSAGNVADGKPVAGNSIAFNGTGGTSTNDLLASVYNISFNKSATPVTNGPTIANAGSYTIAGDAPSGHATLTINGGIDNNSTNTQTFTTGLVLGASQAFNANSTGGLQFGSAVGAGNGAIDLKAFTLSTTGSVDFKGTISNSTGSGAITVLSGTTTLEGSNSYTGGTKISGGTLIASSDGNLGGTSGSLTFDGGTLKLGASFDPATTRAVTVNGTSSVIDTNGFSSIFNQQVQNASGVVVLSKNGGGSLTLGGSGDNLNLGMTANAGTLILNKASSSTVHAIGSGLTINTGATVQLSGTGGDQIYDNTSVTLNNGGIFDMNAKSETFQTLTVSGNGAIQNTAGGASVLTIQNGTGTGSTTYNADSTVDVSAGTLELKFNNTVLGNGHVITKTGNGSLTLSGTADNSGLTAAVSAGTLVLGKTSSSTVHAVGATDVAALTINAGGTAQLGGSGGDQIYDRSTVSIASGGAFDTNGKSETIQSLTLGGAGVSSGGALANSAGSASTLTVQSGGGTSTTTFSADTSVNVATNGSLNLALNGTVVGNSHILDKIGGGSLTLSGTGDNVSLSATVDAGILILGKTSGANVHALGSSSSGPGLTVNSGGTVQLGGSGGNQFFDSTPVKLNGGTFNTGGLSEHGASNNTAGIGALTLQSSSIIDMANASSIIAFADSHTASWTGTLKIYDWTGNPVTGNGTDQLYIGSGSGTANGGLTSTQLGEIQFFSDAGMTQYGGATIQLANGELVPVPEPGTWIGAALVLGSLFVTQRRRLFRLVRL